MLVLGERRLKILEERMIRRAIFQILRWYPVIAKHIAFAQAFETCLLFLLLCFSVAP